MESPLGMTIDIPFIYNSLGQSIIYEEYKGNFAQARQIASDKLDDTRKRGEKIPLADALLALGVVCLLQSELSIALKCFYELEHIVPDIPEYGLKAANYIGLANSWRYNLFPDGGGANAIELQARWNFLEDPNLQMINSQSFLNQMRKTSNWLELCILKDFLLPLYSARSFVQTGYSKMPDKRVEELLQTALQVPITFRQNAEKFNATLSIIAYADLAGADLCHRARNFQLAAEFLNRALGVYQQANDWSGIAACYMMYGDWLSATFSNPGVWNFSIQEGNSSGSDLSWTMEDMEFSQKGANLNEARNAYMEAERFFKRDKAARGLAQLQIRSGYLAMLDNDYSASINFAIQAQETFKENGDILGYWLAQTHRILYCIGAGRYPEKQNVAEAIGKWGISDGSFSYALGLGLFIGRVGRHWLIREGDYERSLACNRLADTVYNALGANINHAKNLVDQAGVYLSLSERSASLILFEQALDIYQDSMKAKLAIAESLRNQAIMLAHDIYQLYLQGMNADGMERGAERLKDLASKLPGESDYFYSLETFALTNLARSTIEQASVFVSTYRAMAALNNGNQEEADNLFQEAFEAVGKISIEQRDFLEAIVLSLKKEYKKAVESYHRYLTRSNIDNEFISKLTSIMQEFAGQQGQMEVQRQKERVYENAFSFMVHAKAYENARIYLNELIKLKGQNWWMDDRQPWTFLTDCAEMYEGLKDWQKAIEYYDKAIEQLETRRNQLSRDELKISIAAGSSAQYLYFQAARVSLILAEETQNKDKYAKLAFSYAESGKARTLLDLMAGSATLAKSSREETKNIRAWRECNAQLTVWRGLLAIERGKRESDENRVSEFSGRIQVQENKLRQIELQIAQSDPEFYKALNLKAEIMSLDEVCKALPEDTLLIQYAFLGNDFLSWGITDKGIVSIHKAAIDAKRLSHNIREFHSACMEGKTTEPLGTQLSEIFLTPFKNEIQKYCHLIIVPYGAAHVLPFHALTWEDKPLVEKHTISYLPSTSSLQFVHPGSNIKIPEQILAIGNPKDMVYRDPLSNEAISASKLPAAEIEAVFVAKIYPEGKYLTYDRATKKAVLEMLPAYPFLHFATHGVLFENVPLLSSILLANGESLSVYELMGMQLNAQLVVLSACRTALGEVTGGDDVIGLTRGLLAAGAQAAVVSLWPINDISTSLFMGEFYRQLGAGNAPASAMQAAQKYLRSLSPEQIKDVMALVRDAVRDAKRQGMPTALDSYQHPRYWAPFILVG